MRRCGTGLGGRLDRATDPWVSFSSDGSIVYSITDAFNANGPAFGGASSIIISRSTDGGVTWQTPVTARLDTSTTVLNDKESVTADATSPLTAYATWYQRAPSAHANPGAFNHSPAFCGPAMFSKTTDGGVTWSNGRVIFDPGEENETIGNQIVVPAAGAASGMLIDGFDLILNKGGLGNNQRTSFSVAVIRSSDGGATWSQPIIVAQQNFANVSEASQGTPCEAATSFRSSRPDPTTLYAVWQDGRFSPTGASKVALSMSSDGGLTGRRRSASISCPGDTPAFTPQVHVAATARSE